MGKKHEIFGVLRLPVDPVITDPFSKKPWVQLQDANYITNLGWWLKQLGLEGKRVKITIEEL